VSCPAVQTTSCRRRSVDRRPALDHDEDDASNSSSSLIVGRPSTNFVSAFNDVDVDASTSFRSRELVEADCVWRPW